MGHYIVFDIFNGKIILLACAFQQNQCISNIRLSGNQISMMRKFSLLNNCRLSEKVMVSEEQGSKEAALTDKSSNPKALR